MTDALATITAALVDDWPGQPDVLLVRCALRQYALVPSSRTLPRPAEAAAALGWLERASLPLSELEKPRNVRLALDALTLRLDGTAAAATTIRRKRPATNGGRRLHLAAVGDELATSDRRA